MNNRQGGVLDNRQGGALSERQGGTTEDTDRPGPVSRAKTATRASAAALPLLLAVVAGAAAACSGADEAPPREPPNVILLVMDTVRADHLSCYGYDRPTTPGLKAFAAGADRYTNVRSTAPWTLPSHASMFTGLFPFQHGAQSRRDPATGQILDALPLQASRTTLAEALHGEGYATGAFVANGAYLGRRYGLDQGFDVYEERERGVPADAPRMNAKALAWLDRRGDEPFFLFVNYIDAHRPYNVTPLPPERAAQLPPPDPEPPVRLLDELCHAVLEEQDPPSPELVRRVITQYDTALANLDLALTSLFAELDRRGLLEDALVIVTSDHGEYFGEHDLVEHSKDVYEEALRVPLIVKRPGQSQGRVIDELRCLVELPCMVLGELPPTTAARLAGDFPCGGRATLAELRYTRLKDFTKPYGRRFDRERTVLYQGRYKLIRSTDGHHELYDLEADPHETHNLFDPTDELSTTLLAACERMRAEGESPTGADRAPELSPEELEQMRQLGYIDGDEDEER